MAQSVRSFLELQADSYIPKLQVGSKLKQLSFMSLMWARVQVKATTAVASLRPTV